MSRIGEIYIYAQEVILAATERQAAVAALVALSAAADSPPDTVNVNQETMRASLEERIMALEETYQPSVDAVGPGGYTPLLVACKLGSADYVEALLGLGANPAVEGVVSNVENPDEHHKCTPLLLATVEGRTEIMKVLLSHYGIDVNQSAADNNGATALLLAAFEEQAAVVKLLLAHDEIEANKATTNDGSTPLSLACQKGYAEIVELLLAHERIEVNKATTDDGSTPLSLACQNGHVNVVTLLLAHDRIEANKATTDDGATPLSIACLKGHAKVVALLLAHDGIEVNQATTDGGTTALAWACQAGNLGVVALLLAHGGIEVNNARTDGGTPLHAAVYAQLLSLAQLLVVHGASLDTAMRVDDIDYTPAQAAAQFNSPLSAEWLGAVASWSPLRVAAGCRLHRDAAFLLRRGRIDPDDPAVTSIKDILAVVATANAKPAALPWQNAPPICNRTAKLMVDATRGWHRTTHWLHHKHVRAVVLAVVMVVGRLDKGGAPQNERVDEPGPDTAAAMPVLPIDLWFHAMGFIKRSWWAVGE